MTRRLVAMLLRLAPATFRAEHTAEFLAIHDLQASTP